mgnify:CR=1 FL=1
MKRSNKKGSIIIFLSIVLSAVILVQTILFSGVSLRYREIEARRTMQLQSEYILSKYNEKLLKNYGLYGLERTISDFSVFEKTNRFSKDAVLSCVSNEKLSEEHLEKMISEYMTLRYPTIMLTDIGSRIAGAIIEVKSNAIYQNGGKKSFYWMSQLKTLMGDPENWMWAIEGIESLVDVIDFNDKLDEFYEFIDNFKMVVERSATLRFQNPNGSEQKLNVFNPASFTQLLEVLTSTIQGSDNPALNHLYVNAYAGNYFDSRLESIHIDGKSIPETNPYGTPYTEINSTNQSDIEYLLTGANSTSAANFQAASLIFLVRAILNLSSFFLDDVKLYKAQGVAEILCLTVALLSAGTVVIDPVSAQYVILLVWAMSVSFRDVDHLKSGKSVSILHHSKVEDGALGRALSTDYRDYITFFLLFVSDDKILTRMLKIFERINGGDITVAIRLELKDQDHAYFLEDGYDLYK